MKLVGVMAHLNAEGEVAPGTEGSPLPMPRPTVSVIMPVLNEAKVLRETLASLLREGAPDYDLEILVVDGKSTDGSDQVVAEIAGHDPRVRLLVNERARTPFALNLGLREAKGEYVGILGAHAVYDRGYVSTCLREMVAHGATGCTGRVVVRPSRDTFQGRLAAWAFGHPFGSSSRSFRTQPEGFVDTVAYPVIRRQALLDVGGYDETLLRNQDNDMNQRLRAAGAKLYCTWKTSCRYRAPASVGGLLRYGWRNGFWNAVTLGRNWRAMGLRHFVPAAFVCGLAISLALWASAGTVRLWLGMIGKVVFGAALGLHLGIGLVAGVVAAIRQQDAGALLLPAVFLAFHVSYGLGTVWGLLRCARRGA